MPGAGNVALAWVAGVAAPAGVLVRPADVDDREVGIAEPRMQLLPGRNRLEMGVELDALRLEIDDAGLELAAPAGKSAGEDGHARMACELRHLGGRAGRDAVAAVVENKALLTRHAVAPEPQGDLAGKRFEDFPIRGRRG